MGLYTTAAFKETTKGDTSIWEKLICHNSQIKKLVPVLASAFVITSRQFCTYVWGEIWYIYNMFLYTIAVTAYENEICERKWSDEEGVAIKLRAGAT